jgi:hypothetical protein
VPEIESGTSGSVARNCDHWTTEAVNKIQFSVLFSCVVSEESPTRARRQESDSDSEVSVDGRSLELASSHSSDDDESSNRHQHRDVGKDVPRVTWTLRTLHRLLFGACPFSIFV